MALTNPTELRAFLQALGVAPNKRLSQNFLIDGNIVRKIIAEADIQNGDKVVEIGPGPGALTEALIQAGAAVYAVEKDRLFAEALKRFSSVTVFAEDIRHFDLSLIPSPAKVVSNLPYHLTAPILGLLAPRHDLFTTLTVMVQEEVARRMTAEAKGDDYGSLALFLRFYGKARYAFKVSRHCFYPEPSVNSAVVTITLHTPPSVDAEKFFALVHRAFQQRRKMVRSTLGKEVELILEEIGENPQSRPEELSLETFLELYNRLAR